MKSPSGYNLPRFWEVTWAQTYSTVLGRNVTEVEPTNLRQHQVYIEVGHNTRKVSKGATLYSNLNVLQVYINWLYLIFLYLTPISILTVFNIRIYR